MGSLDTSAPTSPIDNGDVKSPGCRKERMDPVGYDRHEPYLWQLDRAALDRTTFLREPHVSHQHLDVGCGVGGFTRNVLLPLGGSVTRIVAADISPSMLQFARGNNAPDRIVYDHLDIDSAVETSAFVTKYGQFARVYSFLCFHLVSDQTASFRNIGRLLSTDGECLVTACVTNPALDAWLDVLRMPEWKNLVPDPRAVLPSSSVRFHYTGAEAEIEEETRQCVTNAGLECIACEVLQCPWLAPDIGHFCDIYTDCFLVDANVPPMDRDAFKEVYIERLRPWVKQTPSGWEMSVGIYRVHARSRSPAPAVPDAAA